MTLVHAGLAPERATLQNGVTLVSKETHKTPALTVSFAVRAGSICDPVGKPGAVHLLSRVIDRGTAARSAVEIADELDGRGVSLSITVTRHLFTLTCTCLSEDFEAILEVLADIITNPEVPETELATRRGEVITSLRQDEDSPAVQASERLMELLYGPDHPYGRRAKGTVRSVQELTRAELIDLHQRYFAPSHLTIAVVGDVGAAQACDTVARFLGQWRTPDPAVVLVPHAMPAPERRELVLPMMNKAQADIAYGFTTIARGDASYHAFALLNNALGQYALGGRLGDNIRERQGMAYYVSSALNANVVEGPLTIRAGVSAANVDRTIAAIDEELIRLRDHGLTSGELSESRQYMIGSLPRTLETNAGIAQFLQTAEFFGLGLDYDLRFVGLLNDVTLEQMQDLAERYLHPRRASVVIAGPYERGAAR